MGEGGQTEDLRLRVTSAARDQLQRSSELDFLGTMPIEDQIDHALGFASTFEQGFGSSPASVVDLGTGGGLPGLVLIACWPDASFVLIDANQRRTDFLVEEIERSGQGERISVVRARAEEAGRADDLRERADLVVARSFGAPGTTAECASPLLAVGGRAVISEPPGGQDPGRWVPEGLAQLGLEASSRHRYLDRFGYQVLVKVEACDERYPRRVGIPAKRPLF